MPLSSVKISEHDEQGNIEVSTVAGISAFLGKLWKMVEDPKTNNLISWGKSGNTFVIKNQLDFAKTILPNYYKHNNIASFIRQLNMYGFHKIISTTSGTLDSNDNDEIEFTHPCFVRGHPYLLEQIKRKMYNPKENIARTESTVQVNESIKKVLNDIKNLKGKQEHLGSQLCSVKQENEILWRELSLLRQKHAAQQNILNKLIRFLVSLAQPNHGLQKRRLIPLMLKDSATTSKGRQEPQIQEGDHVYSLKNRNTVSPGPTIHEIHPSEIMDEVQIIDAPVMEVTADVPVVIENELGSPSEVEESPLRIDVTSPEPVPTALLRSNQKGKKRIQTVYLTPDQQMSTHFLITQPRPKTRNSPEYLIPEQTDNPLMELVHETEAEEEGEYITLLTDDGTTEVLPDVVSPATVIPAEADTSTSTTTGRKRTSTARRKSTKKTTPLIVSNASKSKPDGKRKTNIPTKNSDKFEKTTLSSEKVNSAIRSEDFLFDVNLQNFSEPLIEIHTPGSNYTESAEDTYSNITGSPSKQLKVEIPLTIDDAIATISPSPTNSNNLNTPVSPSNIKVDMAQFTREPLVQSPPPGNPDQVTLSLRTASGAPIENTSDLTFDLATASHSDLPDHATSGSADDALMERINECIDNAQNMKIACQDSAVPPTKAYVDDMAMQLDSMQTDINSLKELMQNEGLTLDVNTLMDIFNENPLDYNMPNENSSDFHKSAEEKIMGNELISAPSIFDFNDIFSNEWSQPSTPLSTIDSDYCSLNTPQIDRNSDDIQPMFPPPNKKVKR